MPASRLVSERYWLKLYAPLKCVSVITFCGSRRRRKMYCVCLSTPACPHYGTDPDVTWGSGRGCPLVVHYWADLQSVHGLRWYGNITRTRKVSECMLVLALCLVHDCYYHCIPCQKYHGIAYEKYHGFWEWGVKW